MDPISAIQLASPVTATGAASQAGAVSPKGGADFLNALGKALEHVDTSQHKAAEVAKAYQMGEAGATLESSMIALQEANISLQFAVQVRNKVVSAYHDIMNMPV
jgi:flagellar hook-basal body complex protein FliE